VSQVYIPVRASVHDGNEQLCRLHCRPLVQSALEQQALPVTRLQSPRRSTVERCPQSRRYSDNNRRLTGQQVPDPAAMSCTGASVMRGRTSSDAIRSSPLISCALRVRRIAATLAEGTPRLCAEYLPCPKGRIAKGSRLGRVTTRSAPSPRAASCWQLQCDPRRLSVQLTHRSYDAPATKLGLDQ
jgi:hypothetical protein